MLPSNPCRASHLPLLPLLLDQVPLGARQAIAQEGVPFCDHAEAPALGRFVLFDGSQSVRPQLISGQVAIDIAALADDEQPRPWDDLIDETSAPHAWLIDHFEVREQIARIDKRATRRKMLQRLRTCLEAHGGVWARVSAYPFPYRSAFCLRIDHDDYDAADFASLMQQIEPHANSTTHFVCAATHASHPEALAQLRDHDVGSHGYWHHTYQDERDNHRNISRGIEALAAGGLMPSGFAAPHGRFNEGLWATLESLSISHSSEFGLAYDELPFFPRNGHVLQIPVHPICLGIFLEAAKRQAPGDESTRLAAVQAAAAHLARMAETKYYAGEPVFLYGHPDGRLGRYPQVLDRVVQAVNGFSAIWRTTLSRFAAWWRVRQAVKLRLTADGEWLTVRVSHGLPFYRIAMELFRGDHVAILPLDSPELRFVPDSLAYQSRKTLTLPPGVRIDPPMSLKAGIRRLIDWERVTPIEEISVDTWRGMAKRTLRGLWR